MMFMFGAIALMSGSKLPSTALAWFLITVAWSSVTLFAMILKQKAFKNDKITRVYPIFYTESVFCLLADLTLFHETFSVLQLVGIVMIFTMFAVKMIAS